MVKEKKMAYAMRTISDEINTSHTLHLDQSSGEILYSNIILESNLVGHVKYPVLGKAIGDDGLPRF